MSKHILRLPEPDDWSESIPSHILCFVLPSLDELMKAMRWYERNLDRFAPPFTTYTILRDCGLYMPRKRNENGAAKGNGGNRDSGARGNAKWRWANCRLSDEDVATLEGDTSSMEYLATSFVALADDGYGVTIKSVDSGKSICCTVYRPDFPDTGTIVGVSAFGGSVRDAVLTCLYKLDQYGGGDFSGFELDNGADGSRPRFR